MKLKVGIIELNADINGMCKKIIFEYLKKNYPNVMFLTYCRPENNQYKIIFE